MRPTLKYFPGLLFWLTLCLSLACTAARATAPDFPFTEPQFELVKDAETIDNQPITALAQDTRGLIWIGTQGGLIRYDGYRFRRFAHNINNPFSLAGDYVNALLAASDGRIWVGTLSDGISVFDPATERFEHWRHDPKKPDSLGGGQISDIVEDRHGGIWIATDQGLHHLPKAATQLQRFTHGTDPRSLMDDKVHSLLWDKTGYLWVGTNRGLQRMSSVGKRFDTNRFETNHFDTILTGKNVETLFQARDGKIWIGTREHGVGWLQPGSAGPDMPTISWLPLSQLSHPWIQRIAQVHPDQIWLATFGGGINILSASDGHLLQTLRHDSALSGSLAIDDLKPLLLDRSGWLWVGTWGAGLQRMNTNNSMVRMLRHSPKQAWGLSHPNIRSVLELANGQILFGSNGNGIDVFDRQRGLIKGYRPHRGPGQAAPGSLPDATITALAQTPDGTIWAGTRQSGVIRQRAGSESWEAVPTSAGLKVRAFLTTRDGNLLAGTTRGLMRWQADSATGQGQFEALTDEQGQPMKSSVNALAQDQQGRIWVGTNNGLWLQEPQQRGLLHIPAAPNRASGLISSYIGGLLFDRQQRLWVSTDKGLERMQSRNGRQVQFEHISALMGAPGIQVGANLLEDRAGRIWSEDVVIDRIDTPGQMRMMRLTLADGKDGGAQWLGSYGKTRDGLLLFGGTKGVSIIDPARFRDYDFLPPLVATELKINGETVASGALLPNSGTQAGKRLSLSLTPTQRNFAIEFAALDYTEPAKNRYQYRLQGYSNTWINTDANHRSAAYGNLWPGLYQLQVRGSNRLGAWSPHELTIPIRVLPAWWQTWWFIALMLCLLGLSLLAGLRWRVARLRSKSEALQAMIDARTADIVNLAEIGRELTATLDTELAFDRVYQQVSTRLDAHVFLIGILDEQKAHIAFVYKMEHQQRLPNAQLSLNEHNRAAVWCVRHQCELIANNSAELRTYLGEIPPPSAGNPMETVVYLPLLAEQRVIGCLSVQSPQAHAYNKDQLEFLRILASYSAIALSNSMAHHRLTLSHEALAHSHEELAQSHEELADTMESLKETQAKLIQAERQQISLDLHDNLSQTMTGVLLQLDTAREILVNQASLTGLTYVDRAIELTRDGITQTRHLLKQLRSKKIKPPPIDLINALQRDLPRLTAGTAIKVHVEQQGQLIALPATMELVFFRIAQEAVTNALRHSGAKTISVILTWEVDRVSLQVRDDGCGFDPGAPGHTPGIGLLGMRERVAALAGQFEITSAPGQGTCVSASMPISSDYN
jgi:signal transduction histidine kinase/ligand-binding sensor domain-containing protein